MSSHAAFRAFFSATFGICVLLASQVALPLRAATIVIDNNQPGFVTSLPSYSGSQRTVNNNYHFGQNRSGLVATWTPSAVAAFEPGEEYFVQVNWGVYASHGTHDALVTHAHGATASSISMNQFAAQGGLGSLPTPEDNETSGWYTLGRFTLDANSKVELNAFDAPGTGNDYVSADAVRFSKVFGGEGLIIDETSAGVVYSGNWSQTTRINTSSIAQSIQYRHSSTDHGSAGVEYPLGSNYAGPAEILLSWGVAATQSNNVHYLLDLDGDLGTTADQRRATVSQRQLADQLTNGNSAWSGWYSLGGYHIGPNSKVFLANGSTSFLAADALLMTPILEPSGTIVIDNGKPGFSATGLSYYGSANTVNGDYLYGSNRSDVVAAWTPSPIGGLQPGQDSFVFEPGEEYFVQINWGVWDTHGTHDVRVTHAGGQFTTTIDMTDFAAQGVSLGTLPSPDNNETSGWYTLGRFELDGNSKVELLAANSSHFSADAVRFSKVFGGEGLIIDETSAGVEYTGAWDAATRTKTSAAQSMQYRNSSASHENAAVAYSIGNNYIGPADISLSWGVHPNNSVAVQYLLDLDGDILTTVDQTIATVSQQLLADQTTVGNSTWSGWYSLGVHEIGPDTKVFLTNQTGNYLVADALLLSPVPEPASVVLLAFGLLAVPVIRWRGARRPLVLI